jgi:hypothetical protein
MRTIRLDIDNPDYCRKDFPLPAIPIPRDQRSAWTVGEKVRVELPALGRTAITKVDCIDDTADGVFITLWIEEIQKSGC